jgi:hypothetical protein
LKVGFWVVILVDLLVIQHQPTTSLLVWPSWEDLGWPSKAFSLFP